MNKVGGHKGQQSGGDDYQQDSSYGQGGGYGGADQNQGRFNNDNSNDY